MSTTGRFGRGNASGPAEPIDYSSYGSAMAGLEEKFAGTYGRLGDGSVLAGSEAAKVSTDIGVLKQQRAIDPWSFYRGGAADKLATMGANDPSDIYREKLKQMTMGEFTPDDPSYEFRFKEGQRMLERSLGARGLLDSGNAAVELQQRGQDLASTEYGAQFDRLLKGMSGVEDQYNTSMSRLMELAGVRNAGVGLQKQQVDQAAADNANYQAGIAKSMREPKDVYAGYTFG